MKDLTDACRLILSIRTIRKNAGGGPASLNKAIKDLPLGNNNGDYWDYSHLLSDQQRNAGYSLSVKEYFGAPFAQVHHRGQAVGWVKTEGDSSSSLTPHSKLAVPHRGLGLGKAMYLALYRHALHMNYDSVHGDEHSHSAGRVHESLAREHGVDYRPDDPCENNRGCYSYNIKSERLHAPSLQSLVPEPSLPSLAAAATKGRPPVHKPALPPVLSTLPPSMPPEGQETEEKPEEKPKKPGVAGRIGHAALGFGGGFLVGALHEIGIRVHGGRPGQG